MKLLYTYRLLFLETFLKLRLFLLDYEGSKECNDFMIMFNFYKSVDTFFLSINVFNIYVRTFILVPNVVQLVFYFKHLSIKMKDKILEKFNKIWKSS